jgi:hypothetical protein
MPGPSGVKECPHDIPYDVSATVTSGEAAQTLQWAQDFIAAAETFLAQA